MFLNEIDSKYMLQRAGINVSDTRLAVSRAEAISISKGLGFPVVLKIVSPAVVHKSDIGGVKLNLQTAAQVGRAYADIMAAAARSYPSAKISGVSVQAMAQPGVEVIIGVSIDKQFGPVIMFGLGGLWVEVLKDVSFRLAPLSPLDAAEMIREIKGYPLLTGLRGHPPADIAALEKMLMAISDFVSANPRIKELDLNPVFVSEAGAVAVDARIVLED